jgi:hypothetical protein
MCGSLLFCEVAGVEKLIETPVLMEYKNHWMKSHAELK